MFRHPHISLTEAERALITRTVAGSELELKFGYGGQTGLPEALYSSIVGSLERHARKEEPVTYTNTMWPAENGTYRKTSGPEGDVYIKKVRLSRPETTLHAEFAWFTLKCSEAEELSIRPLPLPDIVTTRTITRTRFSAPITIGSMAITFVYECSVVQTSKGGGTTRSFEIELELPEAGEALADIAIAGVSYLLGALYESYDVPPSFLVPKYEDMQRVIETVNESTVVRNREPFRFKSNPVNIKREDLGRLDEYAMTNKLDGERKVVVSHPSGVWVFHPSGWIPGKIQSCYMLSARSHLPFFVLDTEYYEGRFHVFDVIQWGLSPRQQFMKTEGHEKRMNLISSHLVDLERLHLVRKKFYYGSFRENIGAFMAANDPGQWYDHNDGLIFTPKNGTWEKPRSLKYKVPAKLSIDFRLKFLGENHHQNVYELGVAKYEKRGAESKMTIVPLDSMTLTTFRAIPPLICECVFSHEDRRWIILRDRADKTDPNEIKVAGNVHEDIMNPITFAELAGVDGTIAEREAGFLYESAKSSQRLFAMGFDLLRAKLVQNLMSFYRNSDEKTSRGLDERLYHFYHQPHSLDFDIMHYLTERMGDRYTVYGDLREVSLLQTILGKRGVRAVFDGRTQMVVDASGLAQLSGVSYRHPLVKMIVPGDETPNPMSVVRFPELGSILSGWFPELRRMAIMKAHGPEEIAAWRGWFTHAAIDAYENEEVRCRRMGVRPADSVFLAQYWERKYDMAFLSAIPRSDSRELYLHSPSADPIRERSILNVTTRLLARSCHFVVALVPDSYPIERFGPAVYVEMKQLQGAKILRISAANPAPAMTETPVSLWSLPYVDRYDRLFSLTTGQREVLVRVPKKRTPEMMAAVQMNYHLTPFTVLEWKLIQRDALDVEAARHGYRRTEIVPAEDWDAVWYSKGTREQPKAPEQRIQPKAPEQRIQPKAPEQRDQPRIQPKAPEQRDQPRIQPKAPEQKARGKDDDRGPMRKYHNSQKAILIRTYCKSRRVLDLGAGYGGDLFKYAEADVSSLVLVEPNETNIRSREEVEGTDGLERRLAMSTLRSRSVIVPTVGQDTDRIMQALLPGRAGVVASFFSMTFLFESSSILGAFLDTVDFGLVEGGYFIGTMMEGEKAFEAFRGAKEHRYGKATIVKHYDDTDAPHIGMPLWINIDGTIVKNQNEYLAFFSILKEEMERREFELEWKFDFRPETYFDPIDESDQAFSRMNIGFVFRKMPSRIPNVVRPLGPGVSQEFINLYGDEQVLLRTGVDGNHTFLRSYLYNTSAAYRKIAGADRTRMVSELAEEIAGLVEGNMKDQIRRGEASEEHIIRLMEQRDVNIYLLDAETRRPVSLGPYRVPRRNSVVVMRKIEGAKVWYEPVGFLSNGYAKRILRPFDANLVKLHRTITI
jgi:hypothetical protein